MLKLYWSPAWPFVTVILHVDTIHVGCTTLPTGALGVAGCALITCAVAVEIHPLVFLLSTWYVPAANHVAVGLVCQFNQLLKLNSSPACPFVTVILHVDTAHVGCINVATGALGVAGCALITCAVADEIHHDVFLLNTWYVPAANHVAILLVCHVVPLLKLNSSHACPFVTVILPVDTAHVGCTSVATGALGVAGCALITSAVADEIHQNVFLLNTWYVPAANHVAILLVCHVAPLLKLN